MVQVLLHIGLSLLRELLKRFRTLLLNNLKRRQHVHVSADLAADIALIEFDTLLLLQLFAASLGAALDDLLLHRQKLIDRRAVICGASRSICFYVALTSQLAVCSWLRTVSGSQSWLLARRSSARHLLQLLEKF